MGFFKRVFRIEKKESRTEAVVMDNGFVGPVYPQNDYEKISKEAYCQNVIAFRAIYLVATAAAGIPWKLYRQAQKQGDAPEEIESGAVYDLLYRPNPRQGWASLIQSLLSYYQLSGNAYLERIALQTGPLRGTPKEMYSLRPDRVHVLKDTRGITGYEYTTGMRKVTWQINPRTDTCDLLHLKTFNPLDDFYGHAPTMSAAGHIDNSNDALTWNRSIFKNGARPGTLVTMERSMTPEQYDRFKEQFNNLYGGVQNIGKTLFIDDLGEGKIGVVPFGWNPKELDFTESSREDARRIAWAYGVPPQLVGIPGDSTYSNYKEARESLYTDTIIPLLQFLRDELNNWLFPQGSMEYLDIDISKIAALEAKRNELWDRAEKSTVLTINERRELMGFPPIEGGNAIYMAAGMVPVLGDDIPDTSDTAENGTQIEPLTEDEVINDEEQARRLLLDSGYPQEIIDRYIGLSEEWPQ